jgi:fucose permease
VQRRRENLQIRGADLAPLPALPVRRLNHFAAHRLTARHMSWLHACYSVGATLGPLVMTAMLARLRSWRGGYLVVAVCLAALALVFALTWRRWDLGAAASDEAAPPPASAWAVLREPLAWLQIVLFFIYTGLEVTVGQWSFTVLRESRGVAAPAAGALVAGYWASIVAGRVLFGAVVERVGIDRLLRGSTAAALLGAVLLKGSPTLPLAAAGLVLTGLGLAPIYPCLMTRRQPGVDLHERLGPEPIDAPLGLDARAAWPT